MLLIRRQAGILKIFRVRRREKYDKAGGTLRDLHLQRPLADWVLQGVARGVRVDDASTYLPRFCEKLVAGDAPDNDRLSRELVRLDREGFTLKLVADIWDLYPIEAQEGKLPKPTEKPDEEQQEGAPDSTTETASATTHQQWKSAAKAAQLANKISNVNRDWSSFWRRFCTNYQVKTRPALKKDGEPAKSRREVEIGSLIDAILREMSVIDKATPEVEKRKQAVIERLRYEHGIDEELRQQLLERD